MCSSIESSYIEKQHAINNFVQKLRMMVRAKSLNVWHENPKLASFNNKLNPYLYILRKTTSINHRINRFYKVLGIKK